MKRLLDIFSILVRDPEIIARSLRHIRQHGLFNFMSRLIDYLGFDAIFRSKYSLGRLRHYPLVSVISVNYNGENDLAAFLDALARQSYRNFELIIVDNASRDASREIIRGRQDKFARLHLVESGTNLGFSAGNNLGYQYCNGELIALLNVDTVVDEDWLLELVRPLRRHDKAAAVASKVLFFRKFQDLIIVSDADFSICRQTLMQSLSYRKMFVRRGKINGSRLASNDKQIIVSLPIPERVELAFHASRKNQSIRLSYGVLALQTLARHTLASDSETICLDWDLTRLHGGYDIINNAGSGRTVRGRPYDRGIGKYDEGQYDAPAVLPFFCGCSVLIRRSAVIGRELFVPEMFAYYEDSELSQWLTRQGHKILYAPRSRVYHKHSATSQEGSEEWNFLVERSFAIYSSRDVNRLNMSVQSIMAKYRNKADSDLYHLIDEQNNNLFKRIANKENLYKKEFSIGIYNSYWNSYGGGESHAMSIASVLKRFGRVYLISENDFELQDISSYFNIDTTGCIKIINASINEHFTKRFDLFVNSTYNSNLDSLAKKSWYIVSFPHKTIKRSLIKNYYFLYNGDYSRNWAEKFWKNPEGITVNPLGTLRKATEISSATIQKKKYILSVGRFFPDGHSKKQLEIVHAFKHCKLKNKSLEGWKLVLIGSLDSTRADHIRYYNAIKEELAGLDHELIPNAEKHILNNCFRESYIYVHAAGLGEKEAAPHRHEHFGIAPLEAMTFGCFPVVYHVGGPAELVQAIGLGLTFTSFQDLELKLLQACQTYSSNPINCEDIMNRANQFIESNNLDATISKLFEQHFNMPG